MDEVAREMGFENVEDIVKVASNENALGPSPPAIEAMRKHAFEVHRYPDGGAFHLKRKLAEKLGVLPEQVLPGNGSNELIEFVGHVFLGPGRTAVMSERAFAVYRLVSAMMQAETVLAPMPGFAHDVENLLAAITPQTRVLFIDNPNNPCGSMLDAAQVDRLVEAVPDHLVVCLDEAYTELLPDEIRPDSMKYVREGRNVVVLRTFSKVYGLAGLRLGYAVAHEDCIRLLNRVRQPFNVNSMAMTAGIAALDDEQHVQRMRDLVANGLAFFKTELEKLGLAMLPSVTNFFLVDVAEVFPASPAPGRFLFEKLMERGVIVRPMDGYGLPSHVRITVGTAEENDRCVDELSRVLVRAGQ